MADRKTRPTFDGYLFHAGQRHPIGIYDGNADLMATVAEFKSQGGAFVPGPGGTATFIPYAKIARFMLIPRD